MLFHSEAASVDSILELLTIKFAKSICLANFFIGEIHTFSKSFSYFLLRGLNTSVFDQLSPKALCDI